jgi:PAS domain S-box-containing protein
MRKRVIMVVEDELIVAEDLVHWLGSLGYTVGARAATGREAIRLCETTRPDLILMDILLPGDMDGIEAAEIVRKRFDIPVVYITASSDESTLARAKLTEPLGYVLKPFDERGLYTTIEMAMYKHQSERKLRNSEERFRLLYEHAPVAFQSLDADGHLLQVNKAWQDLFGFSPEEVNGRWFGEFLAPDSVPRFIAAFTQFRNSPATDSITLTIVKRNGMRLSAVLKGSIAVDHRGGFEMTQCVLENRAPSPERGEVSGTEAVEPGPTKDVSAGFAGAWLVASPDGLIYGVTAELERLLESSAERLCSRRLHDICRSEAEASALLAQVTRVGTLAPRALVLCGPAGAAIETTVAGFVLFGQDAHTGSVCLQIRKR